MSPPVRSDLMALTTAALASLSNMGLLKRAQKDLDSGKMPAITVSDDGTVRAVFDDGATSLLPSGRALKDASCSCGSPMLCRHRVGAVLAYQRVHAASVPAAREPESWSPADIDDAALERAIGRGALDRARSALRRGIIAQGRQGTFVGEDVPSVTLATSTVRFLVPRDLAHARCDCTLRTACEHVALATWAFRAAREKHSGSTAWTVELVDSAANGLERGAAALSHAEELVTTLLLQGAAHLPDATEQALVLASQSLERASMAWPLGVLEDTAELWGAYRRRSARYSPSAWSALLLEAFARIRAGTAKDGAVPPRAVLGDDQVLEARLDQVRLVGLGASVEEDGRDRLVHIYLADAASGSILVMRKSYAPSDDKALPEDGPALGRRTSIGGATLSTLAVAQVVSNAATRRANRLVTFGTGPLQRTTVLPQTGGMEALESAGVLVTSVKELMQALLEQPPAFVRPRVLADRLRCVRVREVSQVTWSPSAQVLRARLIDATGNAFHVERSHSALAPGAVPALAQLLSEGGVTTVVGLVTLTPRGPILEVMSVGTASALISLDLATATRQAQKVLGEVPVVGAAPDLPPTGALLTSLSSWLDGVAHNGLRQSTGAAAARLADLARQATSLGASFLAREAEHLVERLEALKVTGAIADEHAAAQAWASVGLRVSLLVAEAAREGMGAAS